MSSQRHREMEAFCFGAEYTERMATRHILEALIQIEENQVALADDIARIQAAVTALEGDVGPLQGEILTPDQKTAIESVATSLEALDATLKGLVPPA